jgi:hypothetical protein
MVRFAIAGPSENICRVVTKHFVERYHWPSDHAFMTEFPWTAYKAVQFFIYKGK